MGPEGLELVNVTADKDRQLQKAGSGGGAISGAVSAEIASRRPELADLAAALANLSPADKAKLIGMLAQPNPSERSDK